MKYRLENFSENEQNWIKVINKINKEANVVWNPDLPQEEVVMRIGRDSHYELRNKPYMRREIFDIEHKLIMKHVIMSSNAFVRLKSKREMIMSLETLMIFLVEELEKKIDKDEDDYYHYMDHLDVLKGFLEYAHLLGDNESKLFEKIAEMNTASPMLRNYEIKEDIVPSKTQLKSIEEG